MRGAHEKPQGALGPGIPMTWGHWQPSKEQVLLVWVGLVEGKPWRQGDTPDSV